MADAATLSFDDFVSSLPKKPTKKKAVTTTTQKITPEAQQEVTSAQEQDAFVNASGAASDLLQAISQYKNGAISKNQAAKIYFTYQSRINTLAELNPSRAANVESSITGKPATETKIAKDTALKAETTPLATGGKPGPNAPKISDVVVKPDDKKATIASTTSTPPAAASANTDTSGGGKYANVKGVLNYNGQPFTGQYNDKYYSAGKVETPEQIKADFISKFGVQAALVASDPELSALFTQAVSAPSQGGGWSADKWKTEFENTQWYKTRTSAARASEIQRVSSPVDYSQAYNNARQKAQMVAAAEGIQLTDKQLGAAIPDADLSKVKARDVTGQDLAQWVLDNNPTDQQLRAHLVQVGQVNATALGGTIQANAQQLKQYANDLGLNNMVLPASSKDGLDFFAQSAKQIEAGTTDINTQKQYLINLAKSNFPAYAAQLDSGITVRQLAAPYINTVANLLEISPDQIDLSKADGYGNMVFKALQGNNDPKNPVPMDLSTFQNQVRSMPQWLNTQNAKTSILDSGSQLLQTFGLVR